MKFDDNGNLHPYEVIETNLETFEKLFVESFSDSTTRRNIFENYLRYTNTIKELINEPFYQWIDGSYVTQKINPNDIDVLTFVPFEPYKKQQPHFEMLRRWRFNKNFGIDGYFLQILPTQHPDFRFYEYDCKDWLNTFSTGRKFENKGLVKITF